MSIVLSMNCPVCGLTLSITASSRTGRIQDVDGDFIRDPSQHLHETVDSRVQCANSHRWFLHGDIVLERT